MKIIGHIPDALVKEVDELMSEWQVSEKHESLVVELGFLAFMFCMWQRFIKVKYEQKLNNTKKN